MAFVVVYDACVLHPAPLRDLLIRIAASGIVRARWTERILEECVTSILERRPDLTRAKLNRTTTLMVQAVPDCMVHGHETLIAGLDLPDENDRHVLAAAIRSGAQAIVTYNLRDFPEHVLEPFGIEAKHPDEFVVESIDISPAHVMRSLAEQAADCRKPPRTVGQVCDTLLAMGLARAVARLRELGA